MALAKLTGGGPLPMAPSGLGGLLGDVVFAIGAPGALGGPPIPGPYE